MTDPTEPLRAAYELAHGSHGSIEDPHFAEATRVHDWRNYVPGEIRTAWPHLSTETRMAVFLLAEEMAGREEWE